MVADVPAAASAAGAADAGAGAAAALLYAADADVAACDGYLYCLCHLEQQCCCLESVSASVLVLPLLSVLLLLLLLLHAPMRLLLLLLLLLPVPWSVVLQSLLCSRRDDLHMQKCHRVCLHLQHHFTLVHITVQLWLVAWIGFGYRMPHAESSCQNLLMTANFDIVWDMATELPCTHSVVG